MKILMSVAVWGRTYSTTYTNFSLASLLSPKNLPRLVQDHHVELHIVTSRADAAWLLQQPNVQAAMRLCPIVWDLIEDHGYAPALVPVEFDNEKYPFLSRLQNLAFERSLNYDFLIFNYADFIWADGALSRTMAMIDDSVDAVLSFCLPVDQDEGKRALAPYRTGDSGPLSVSSRETAGIAIDHLHREARLRIWDNPEFTSTPTYLIWRVEPDGLLIRAYHQTVLALRVDATDPNYGSGIRHGSLDGYFTDRLAGKAGLRHVTNSDDVAVFSLHYTKANSATPQSEDREDIIGQCLRTYISPGQRQFAEIPFQMKRSFTTPMAWEDATRYSWQLLSRLHATAPQDGSAFEALYASRSSLALLEGRWSVKSHGHTARLRIWIYRRIIVQMIAGPAGRLARALLGQQRATAIARRLRVWIFGDKCAS